MTDSAGRVHRYGYGTDSFGNVILTSYTDPAGKVTTYGYEGRAVLNRITDPNGNVTTFLTDASQRVTSLTRVTDPATGAGSTWSFDYSTPCPTHHRADRCEAAPGD
jgi:YD repeat-containing protein